MAPIFVSLCSKKRIKRQIMCGPEHLFLGVCKMGKFWNLGMAVISRKNVGWAIDAAAQPAVSGLWARV